MTHPKPAPKSSPLPWSFDSDSNRIDAAAGMSVAMVYGLPNQSQNAALIVRRVNQGPAFDAMVEALREGLLLLDALARDKGPTALKMRAALKLAQEVK